MEIRGLGFLYRVPRLSALGAAQPSVPLLRPKAFTVPRHHLYNVVHNLARGFTCFVERPVYRGARFDPDNLAAYVGERRQKFLAWNQFVAAPPPQRRRADGRLAR